jgi:hypothetical protein
METKLIDVLCYLKSNYITHSQKNESTNIIFNVIKLINQLNCDNKILSEQNNQLTQINEFLIKQTKKNKNYISITNTEKILISYKKRRLFY